MSISVHNSASEQVVTPEMIDALGYEKLTFVAPDGFMLPYRRLVTHPELPGRFSLMIFFHGVGSVGADNFLQMRIPGRHFADYAERHRLKTVLLFPQCHPGSQWVDVPWDAPAHNLPERPSTHMAAAMELLRAALEEFSPDPAAVYAGGLSMGGYGAWDIVSRMPETFSAILAICGGADVKQAPRLRNLRVYACHGARDATVPPSRSRDMISALRAAGNDRIMYRELPDAAHNAWDAVFADDVALDFIFRPACDFMDNKKEE